MKRGRGIYSFLSPESVTPASKTFIDVRTDSAVLDDTLKDFWHASLPMNHPPEKLAQALLARLSVVNLKVSCVFEAKKKQTGCKRLFLCFVLATFTGLQALRKAAKQAASLGNIVVVDDENEAEEGEQEVFWKTAVTLSFGTRED